MERNAGDRPLPFLQMWPAPLDPGGDPHYEVVPGTADSTPYALPEAGAMLHVRRLTAGERTAVPDAAYVYAHVVRGRLRLDGEEPGPGDAARLTDAKDVEAVAFGLGRYSGLEHLDHGEKVLEIREMPAAWLLPSSYRHIESACLDAELIREKRHLEQVWVREALEGRWFGELRLTVQSFVDACAARTTGSVTWRLRNGGADTRAVTVPSPLYLRDREAWENRAIAAESAPFARAARTEALLTAV